MSIQLPRIGAGVPEQPNTTVSRPAERVRGQDLQTGQEQVTLKGSADETLTYANPRAAFESERPDLASLLAESDRQVEEFMTFLRSALAQQGLEFSKVASGEQQLTLDQATIDQAQADIAEDGEWGVRAVAERILNFAKIGIGDDSTKIETFRAAIQKGFDEAQAIFGGKLPEVSQQTHAAIMAELDRWQAEGVPAGLVSLAPAAGTDAT
ncbi:MAG: hypothetical protein CGU28_15815 [Candidatus Dactylopiibacterium carminicum]|uniref:DUF5610 domain-containing protein n=1 Tax=Candidatus Dactylopiibacterium carminicum TaxID=857335 RepID=A0A272EP96_9RHOO|nr:hypothetical protein [Candidatus Dactylopiibacterium carminicum]KAF7597921.1 hypothetical protein BGI27_16120 [Candidatus Dactylopiibacterium carminicum]PAS91490.1 MAG: hypothetical protein CGU29_16120 [Candidatus Dactylopiibacterium carminicum]PAS93006.1 MAG: hypothetical protein CGU28_15815 [Candidatus Dactylopiibacterium carminicum]PAS95986.1 MAG: hypothetical protein BSR46_16155 [Candidatus Dactylopiibacterium carminicum]